MTYIMGFFFNSQFSQVLTDALVPTEVEKQFNIFLDLKYCNVTLYLRFNPKGKHQFRTDVRIFGNLIVESNISYRIYNGIYEYENMATIS